MDTKASGIYKISNTVTGKLYVGSAVNIAIRWREHRCDLRRGNHRNQRLQRAWLKYGESAFSFSVLETVHSHADLIAREQHWIDALRAASRENYNIFPVAGSLLGMKLSAETRAKMSAAHKARVALGIKRSREAIRKTALAHTGMKRSPETCARISAAKKGKKQSVEAIAKRVAKTTGQKRSPEVKAKMSAALRGLKRSPEARANMSAAMKGRVAHNKGKPMSPGQRQKMSEIRTAWWRGKKQQTV